MKQQTKHIIDNRLLFSSLQKGKQFSEKKIRPSALVVLNSETINSSLFEIVWDKSIIKVCADGGANRLLNFSLTHKKPSLSKSKREQSSGHKTTDLFIPDAICGDFDSVKQETLDFYRDKGVEVNHIKDQNSTDMDKCLKYVIEALNSKSEQGNGVQVALKSTHVDVVVIGAFGGRFDHQMAHINSAMRWYVIETKRQVYRMNPSYLCLGATDSKRSCYYPLRPLVLCCQQESTLFFQTRKQNRQLVV